MFYISGKNSIIVSGACRYSAKCADCQLQEFIEHSCIRFLISNQLRPTNRLQHSEGTVAFCLIDLFHSG